jgi:hypothetical protein
MGGYCGFGCAFFGLLVGRFLFGPHAPLGVPATGAGAVAIFAVFMAFALPRDLASSSEASPEAYLTNKVFAGAFVTGIVIIGFFIVWLLSPQ